MNRILLPKVLPKQTARRLMIRNTSINLRRCFVVSSIIGGGSSWQPTLSHPDNASARSASTSTTALLSCRHGWNHYTTTTTTRTTNTTSSRMYHASTLVRRQQQQASSSSDNSNTNNDNSIPFLLADIGEGIKEVELLQWYVQEGDTVQQFDKICEVQSDKATVEITSRFDGIVTSLQGRQAGDMMQVGEPLLYLKVPGSISSNSSSSQDTKAESAGEGTTTTTAATTTITTNEEKDEDAWLTIPTVGSQYHLESDDDHFSDANSTHDTKFMASPAVRKLAHDHGIMDSVNTIRGTGPQGRILKIDVITYLKEQGLWKGHQEEKQQQQQQQNIIKSPIDDEDSTQQQSKLFQQGATTTTTTTTTTPEKQPKPPKSTDDGDQIITLKGYNRMMFNAMTKSLQIPHMGFADEVVVNDLMKCRKEINQQLVGVDGSSGNSGKLSMLPFFIKACSMALGEHPSMNSIVYKEDEYQYIQKQNHNIGIAMDTPRGLVVPVIHSCQTKSILEIQQELNRLKDAAATSSLTEHDLADCTFLLSNIGSMGTGGTYMQPVLVPPAMAIGAFGKVQTLPRFRTNANVDGTMIDMDSIYAAHVLNVSWAADHRFLDGATLCLFHSAFKKYVEHPMQMLVHLQ